MKLIEADKVEQAIKDYWKAQVDKALTLTDGNVKRINIYLEHNHELLKVIDELPSVQPEIIRCPDCYYNDGTAYCELHFRNVKAKDYCSWAERRKDG